MQITVEHYGPSAAMLAARFGKVPAEFNRAMRDAVSNAGNKTLTQVRRALQIQTGVKRYGTIVSHTRGYMPDGLTFVIEGSGKGLPIDEFSWRGSRSPRNEMEWDPRQHWKLQPRLARGRFGKLKHSNEGGVTANVWNNPHLFKRSYVRKDGTPVATLPGGKKTRLLYGPAIWKEIVKDQAKTIFETYGRAELAQQAEKKLHQILGI